MNRRLISKLLAVAIVALAAASQGVPFVGERRAAALPNVLYVDPNGNDSNSGTSPNPLRTVMRALELAQPGMKVRLRTGIYRERIVSVRHGTAEDPIVIEPDGDDRPIIDGNYFRLDAPKITHSYITIRHMEIRYGRLGLRLEHAHHVAVYDNVVHDMGGECIRLRYNSRYNSVIDNKVFSCGRLYNGEGIYVGTAPEQRYKYYGEIDASRSNVIRGNEIYRVTEGIDLKEDSSYTWVEDNYIHHASDPDSAGINIRSDRNTVRYNRSLNNAGSGYRMGGDSASGFDGAMRQYGVRNYLTGNLASGNDQYGYKVIVTPQDINCSNEAYDNERGSFNGGFECG